MTTTAKYYISNQLLLRKILWADVVMGGTTALIGLLVGDSLVPLLGLTADFIRLVSIVTLVYAIVALRLAVPPSIAISLLRVLIAANWVWALISVLLLVTYGGRATTLGLSFLLLQVLVVGGLAYLEGKQIMKKM